MKQKELSELTDQELVEEAKRTRLSSITNALFIGFLLGIVVYSIWKNNFGFLALIPLYFAYKLANSAKNKDLERLLKERRLK